MINTRRDLLKFFGIGAAIVPVIGGVPMVEQPAKLITLPDVEPIKVVQDWRNVHEFECAVLGNRGMARIEIHIHTPDKRVWHFKANTFINKTHTQYVDVTHSEDPNPWRKRMDAGSEMRWSMEGVCTGHTECDVIEYESK